MRIVLKFVACGCYFAAADRGFFKIKGLRNSLKNCRSLKIKEPSFRFSLFSKKEYFSPSLFKFFSLIAFSSFALIYSE